MKGHFLNLLRIFSRVNTAILLILGLTLQTRHVIKRSGISVKSYGVARWVRRIWTTLYFIFSGSEVIKRSTILWHCPSTVGKYVSTYKPSREVWLEWWNQLELWILKSPATMISLLGYDSKILLIESARQSILLKVEFFAKLGLLYTYLLIWPLQPVTGLGLS